MQSKQDQLIDLLKKKKHTVTSAYLAREMGVSTSVIKNLVKQINNNRQSNLIVSSKVGYELSGYVQHDEASEAVPQSYLKRAFLIVKTVLLQKQEFGIHDIADMLYVSYSTVKNTLQRMNKTFQSFDIRFLTKKDIIYIEGHEENLRRLIMYIISEETKWQFFDLNALYNSFDKETVQLLIELLRETYKDSFIRINDYSFMNLLLNLLILVERVRHGKHSTNKRSLSSPAILQNSNCLEICFVQRLEQMLQIRLLEEDRLSIAAFLSAATVQEISKNTEEALFVQKNEVCEPENEICIKIREVIAETADVYGINMLNTIFLSNFNRHVQGLLKRYSIRGYSRNPLLASIKEDCKSIYDIAVFISIRLSDLLGVTIDENETAYIALHIINEIHRQKSNELKIQALLFCPTYLEMTVQLEKQLNLTLGQEVFIKAIVSQFEDIDNYSYDLIISTVDLPLIDRHKVIRTSFFLNEEKKSLLLSHVNDFRLRIMRQRFFKALDQYFLESLFFCNNEFSEKETLIHTICTKMHQMDLVQKDFEQNILEREKAASTAFSCVAIPHSIRMDAVQTCIAVVISKNGIQWDNSLVHVVFLFAINRVDRNHFHTIYEALTEVFDDHQKMTNKLLNVQSMEEFQQIIKDEISRIK